MEGRLFAKYAHMDKHQEVLRITERGQLMEYFCKRINAGRIGTKWKPVSMPRMGRILQGIPTKDLYYLKRICDDSRIFSQRFFWELNPAKHGTLAADIATGARS